MKKIVVILLFFCSLQINAQTSEMWQQSIGGPGVDYGYSVKSCLNQGYVVAGSYSSNGISDGYLVRTDSLGLIMWSKFYSGNNVDVLRSIIQLPDSGFVLAGYSNSKGHGGYDGWVLRTDKNGDTLWTKYIGTSDWDFFYSVDTTYDGGFILAGGTYGAGAGDEDMYFVKLNSVGDTLWTKTYGGIKQDEARSIIQTGDSMLATVGFSYSQGDLLGDSWILRMTSLGDTVWSRTLGQGTTEDKALGIADMSQYGRFVVVGESSVSGDQNAFIAAFTFAGSQVFIQYFGIAGADNFSGVITTPSGNIAALGTTENVGSGNGDFSLFRDYGTWGTTTFGTTSVEEGYSLDNTHDNGYILCGYTEGYNSVLPNIYLIKTDTLGYSSLVLGIREQPTLHTFGGISIFPNPTSNEAMVMVDLNEVIEQDFSGTIFDVFGKNIATYPFSKFDQISNQTFSFHLATEFLENGLYYFEISDSSGRKSGMKFIVNH